MEYAIPENNVMKACYIQAKLFIILTNQIVFYRFYAHKKQILISVYDKFVCFLELNNGFSNMIELRACCFSLSCPMRLFWGSSACVNLFACPYMVIMAILIMPSLQFC